MKQQKVASVPPPAPKPAPPEGPRYRYFSTTPETVTLRMRDLQIPEKARTPGYNSEHFIDLPCSDIFRGAVPKILLSRLAELAPDSITAKDLPDEGIKVCSARLALAYMVTERRERLSEASSPEPTPVVVPPLEEFAPPSAAAEKTSEPALEAKKSDPIPTLAPESVPAPKAAEEPSKDEPGIPKPKVSADLKTVESEPAAKEPLIPAPAAKIPPPILPPAASPVVKPASDGTPEIPAKKTETEPEPASPESTPIPAKKPFSLFPMFRRKEATDVKPSIAVPRGRIEIPKPKRPPSPFTDASEEKSDAPTEPKPEAELKEFKPPIPKPRFEPARGFEPKILPVTPTVPADQATPPKESGELPFTPKSETAPEAFAPPPVKETPAPFEPAATPQADQTSAPGPVEAEAPKMPELPSFAPKKLPRYIERMRAAEAAAKKASVPAPSPAAKPEGEIPAKVESETPVDAEKKTEPAAAEPLEEPILPPPPVPEATILPPTAEATIIPPPPAPNFPTATVEEPAAQEPAKPVEEKIEDAPKPPPAMAEIPAPAAPALLVETEHVAQKDAPPEIAEQDALQAIFLTEEFLSVDRVLELCGNLPGIHSCVLSQGASVIASHNAPDTVDIVSLSAHALEMLKAMRASSAKMGIGAVPAVTVHSEKGPITFFHQDDICLLVLHKDRGFIPGVREKLQHVVDELSKAKLPLRLGGGEAKKLPGK